MRFAKPATFGVGDDAVSDRRPRPIATQAQALATAATRERSAQTTRFCGASDAKKIRITCGAISSTRASTIAPRRISGVAWAASARRPTSKAGSRITSVRGSSWATKTIGSAMSKKIGGRRKPALRPTASTMASPMNSRPSAGSRAHPRTIPGGTGREIGSTTPRADTLGPPPESLMGGTMEDERLPVNPPPGHATAPAGRGPAGPARERELAVAALVGAAVAGPATIAGELALVIAIAILRPVAVAAAAIARAATAGELALLVATL